MYRRIIALALICAGLAVFWMAARSASAAPPVQDVKGDPARGAYLFSVAEGCGCHQSDKGFLAGGQEFDLGPAGKVYARNISSDPTTGIGKWTEADIVKVFQKGQTPDGRQLFPVMPYAIFSGMSLQDQHDLAAFIKTAPPASNQVPDRQLNIPVPPAHLQEPAASAPTEGVARGKYLVNAVAQCSDCHTPFDATGAPDMTKFLAGSVVEGEVTANITPDNETGIGSWTEEQIITLLKTGVDPSGHKVEGLMALVVDCCFKDLKDGDASAIAAYLKTVPAVNNVPSAGPPPEAPASTMPATGGDMNNLPFVLALVVGGLVLLGVGALVLRSSRRVK